MKKTRFILDMPNELTEAIDERCRQLDVKRTMYIRGLVELDTFGDKSVLALNDLNLKYYTHKAQALRGKKTHVTK